MNLFKKNFNIEYFDLKCFFLQNRKAKLLFINTENEFKQNK